MLRLIQIGICVKSSTDDSGKVSFNTWASLVPLLNEFPCKYQRRMVYDNQRYKTRRASFVLKQFLITFKQLSQKHASSSRGAFLMGKNPFQITS